MIDPFKLFTNNEEDFLRSALTGTGFAFLGKIKEVIDRKHVVVTKKATLTNQEQVFGCRVFNLTSSLVELDVMPSEGDEVLVVSLQHLSDAVVDGDEPVVADRYNGYTLQSCVAIPIGSSRGKAQVIIKVDDGKVSIDTDSDIAVKGDSKHAVYWEDLNSGLASFLAALKTTMTTTPIAGNGNVQGAWTNFPTKIYIDGAKAEDVTIG